MTKLQDYIEELFETEIITSWKHQNQMHNFKILQEIFDADVELKATYSNKEFRAYFSAANNDWIFHAIKLNNEDIYSIEFYSKGIMNIFDIKKEKWYTGEIFAGVFRCLEKMLDVKNVNGIIFKTEEDKLKSLYTKMIPWVEKRFPNFKIYKKVNNKKWMEFFFKKIDV